MQNLKLSKQYFRILSSVKKQHGKILFVSSLDESACNFIMSCAMACNQEYASLPRWVPGTLTNLQWVNKWNDTQTLSSYHINPPELILCFSNSQEVINEVRSLGIPSLYFVSDNSKTAKVLAAYYSSLIRGF